MNKLTLTVLAAFAVVSVFAQGAGPKSGGAGLQGGQGQRQGMGGMRRMNNPKMMEEMAKRLKLTPDQKVRMKAAAEKMQKEMQALRPKDAPKPGGNGEKSARPQMAPAARDKMMKVFTTYQAEVKKILSPTQQAELKKFQKEMRDKMMKERGAGGGPGGPPPGAKGKGGGGGV